LSIARLVVALQWKVGANFSQVFLSTTAPPLWTTIRTSWNMISGPLCSLMRWFRLRYPFVDSCFGCRVTIINIQGPKIPAHIFIHQ
jgi:hypothetical protein